MNHHLGKIELKAKNIRDDLMDGFFLAMLIETVTGKSLGSYHSRLFAYDLFMIFTVFIIYFFRGLVFNPCINISDKAIEEDSLVEENQKLIVDWFLKLNVHNEAVASQAHYAGLLYLF